MKSKTLIVSREETGCNELSLHIDFNEEGKYEVELIAWHKVEGLNNIQSESIVFPEMEMAKRYIEDYSEESAENFINQYNF